MDEEERIEMEFRVVTKMAGVSFAVQENRDTCFMEEGEEEEFITLFG